MKKTLEYTVDELIPYINWIYFFHAWGMAPRFSTIAEVCDCPACRAEWVASFPETERTQAHEAARLHCDALALLRELHLHIHPKARLGIFPAWSEGDDIVLQTTVKNEEKAYTRLPLLRQQNVKEGQPCLCWADFVVPRHIEATTSPKRGAMVGVFATTVETACGSAVEDDPYRHLLTQTLADRLAEATAERMHEQVRKELWGFQPHENFSVKDLFAEKYEGRRPAVGYPSLPDQSLNFLLHQIVDFSTIGISLTESGMMQPHASVSGLIFDHPASTHFAIGKIGEDQLRDYAARRGADIEEMRKFLSANL